MKQTRFMQVMFSAVERGDEQLAEQVRDDIEAAKVNDVVDTDEVTYTNLGDGKVMIIDKENGEATIAEMSPEEAETYDLIAVPDEELEKFLHPMECGHADPAVVTEEHEDVVEDHLSGTPISETMEDLTVEENAGGCECDEEECECENDEEVEEERSYSSVNTAVLRIFEDQLFCERLFSEVIESEETATVGNIKVEKCDEENAIIVTDNKTGDQAKVEIDNNGDLEITELSQKEFKCYSEAEEEEAEDDFDEASSQYEPLFVVGIDPVEHVIVDSPVYDEEDAQILAQRLSEIGVIGIEIFNNPDEARSHAFALLEGAGVDMESEEEVVEEPEEREFSDYSVFVTRYYSDCSTYMLRLFSEAEEEDSESQEVIEDAIESGEQIENDSEIVTPIDNKTAVIEDKANGEFTKAVLNGEDLEISKISEEEAEELTKDLVVEEDDDEEEEERNYSDVIEVSRYMLRLFSEAEEEDSESQEVIEDAIESGEQIENDSEIVTPIDNKTAVIEDKTTGEFTKAVLNEDDMDLSKISEEEAEELMEDLRVEDEEDSNDEEANDSKEEDVEAHEEENSEEKEFSEEDTLTHFFSEMMAQQPAMQQAPVQPVAQTPMLDANGNVAAPAPAPEAPSVESIEDKALQAVTAIQEAALTAQQEILAAKEAPVQAPAGDLREATFSENETSSDNVLGNWLSSL